MTQGTMIDTPPSSFLELNQGKVTLIGAGPGDPELLTIKGLNALRVADMVLYDNLVSDAILDFASPSAQRIYVGKESSRHSMPQEVIGEKMIEFARQGRHVVRLKGGDGYIFGRGGEEVQALAKAGIPFQVIPGISAAQGAGSAFGIPLTHRDHARALVLATGHLRENKQVDLDWTMLARKNQTVVIYMGVGTLPVVAEKLIEHGLSADTPAAIIEQATLPGQRCVDGTLQTLPALASEHGIASPALIIIGGVVSLKRELMQPAING